jgi:hypothetical protein
MELMSEWVSYDGPATGRDDPHIVGGLPGFEAVPHEADAGSAV